MCCSKKLAFIRTALATRTCENCTRNACDSRMSVWFLTRATCKNVRQNLIPRATAYPPDLTQLAAGIIAVS